MIDIHSHILWGIDDGPAAIEESLEMLQVARDSGTTDIVATPHLNPRFAFQRELALERIRELELAAGGPPKIHLGCEFHLTFDNVDRLMDDPRHYTINQKQYLLVECPDQHVGHHAEGILQRLMDAGVVPIIAHPERNPVLRQKLDRLEKWVDLGCLTQLTALSITGLFGGSAKSASLRMLYRGLVHFVASDAHDPLNRHPALVEARDMVRERAGEETAEIVFTENPAAVVEGAMVSGGRQIAYDPPRPWYKFW